jgi:hypothetical protein
MADAYTLPKSITDAIKKFRDAALFASRCSLFPAARGEDDTRAALELAILTEIESWRKGVIDANAIAQRERAAADEGCAVCRGRQHPTKVSGELFTECPYCHRSFVAKPPSDPVSGPGTLGSEGETQGPGAGFGEGEPA